VTHGLEAAVIVAPPTARVRFLGENCAGQPDTVHRPPYIPAVSGHSRTQESMAARDVIVLVGSLRRESITRKVANALFGVAPKSLALEIVPIGDLPLYNQDDETATPPAPWTTFRQRVQRADAVIFTTPEYNRSVPGVLKNAIDVGSRPPGKSAWSRKPAAVISVSPGMLAGFGANHHLRQSLVFLDMPTLQAPEMYIGNAAALFDASGTLINDGTREFLAKGMAAFAAWIEKTAS
jgi:chromate reductase, NAD(P)H dehydrogenase (quinone)